HVLYEIMKDHNANGNSCPINKSDELPPFDITINFMNEYGQSSKLVIYGVNLISEGQTMSVEDMITENTMEFIALDIETMKPDVFDEGW
ncbi:virion structural protein, partial [Bacillus cereus]